MAEPDMVRFVQDVGDHKYDLWNVISDRLTGNSMSYPTKCRGCGGPRVGTFVFGYRLRHRSHCSATCPHCLESRAGD